jgi:hypothetical protein
MKNSVYRGFKNLPQADSIVFAKNVVQKMTANPLFAAFKAYIDALELIRKAFSDALITANNKDPVLIILKNQKRKEMDEQLDDVAELVNSLAKGDKAVILASGFDFIAEYKTITELLAPTGFKVTNVPDQPGKVKGSWDEVKGTNTYALEMRIKGTEIWEGCAFPSARSVVIKDLKLGSNVEFRVRALGTRGLMSDWSIIVDVWVS